MGYIKKNKYKLIIALLLALLAPFWGNDILPISEIVKKDLISLFITDVSLFIIFYILLIGYKAIVNKLGIFASKKTKKGHSLIEKLLLWILFLIVSWFLFFLMYFITSIFVSFFGLQYINLGGLPSIQ